jgi:hypothetical protein
MAIEGKRAGPESGGVCDLPTGRLLVQAAEGQGFAIVASPRREGFWIVPEGWRAGAGAAGPFRASDILRAYRLANMMVPDGCELGPWQTGIGLFPPATLPGRTDEWDRVDPGWLPPSVSRYSAEDVREDSERLCCAPPTDKPRLERVPGGEDPTIADSAALVASLFGAGAFPVAATLSRAWNAHPAGSPVFAEGADLTSVFLVIDVPLTRRRTGSAAA